MEADNNIKDNLIIKNVETDNANLANKFSHSDSLNNNEHLEEPTHPVPDLLEIVDGNLISPVILPVPQDTFEINNEEEEEEKKRIKLIFKLGFMKKVLGIYCLQFAIGLAWTLTCLNNTVLELILREWIIIVITSGLTLILAIFIICAKRIVRKVPINYIILILYTCCISYIFGIFVGVYDFRVVIAFISMIISSTITLVLYVHRLDKEMEYFEGGLWLFTSLVIMFCGFGLGFNFMWLKMLASFGAALVYSGFLFHFTKSLMNKFEVEFSMDDYIVACLLLHLSVIKIIMKIIQFS